MPDVGYKEGPPFSLLGAQDSGVYSRTSHVELGVLPQMLPGPLGLLCCLEGNGCQSSWFAVLWLSCFTVILANTTPRAVVNGFVT